DSEDFTSSYSGSSSNIQIVNGQTTSQVSYMFNLTPKRAGTLRTPTGTIEIDGQLKTIKPLTVPITVHHSQQPTSSSPGTPLKDVYLVRDLSKNKVFEGEQLITTLKLYSRLRVTRGSFDSFAYDGFWKENLGEPRVRTIRNNGKPIALHEVQHALFPLQSGDIELPPAILKLTVQEPMKSGPMSGFRLFDPDFFGMTRTKEITVRSEPTTLQVLPLPPVPENLRGARSHEQIVVGDLSLSLGVDTDSVTLGEGKTVVVNVESDGNIRPIDSLTLEIPKGMKIYNDTPEEVVALRGGRFFLKKRFRISLVPDHAGDYEIPGFSLLRFDPKAQKYELVKTRLIHFTVAPSPSGQTSLAPAEGGRETASPEQLGETSSQRVYRYQEETILEYLGRTISWSLSLFFFTLTLLLFGTFWVVKNTVFAPAVAASPRSNHSGIERTSNPLQLREEFVRDLSQLLDSSGNREVFRGYLLETKLQEQITEAALLTAITRHLDRLDAISYGSGANIDLHQLQELIKESKRLLKEIESFQRA
ncbi:MAG: BatD family protein, partial [Bdellovibrionales bacterium]|nr:BatD family protein [Bdellovibrionales bacterium]